MLVRIPEFFDDFSCLAGSCPHSCCIGWEVVIDEDTARRYRESSGPLGERIRDAMEFDGEDFCFPLRGGRCPFLNRENLCEIHCAWGEAATSVTCREHPRFTEDYGAFREMTLSAACPKANALLLGSRDPLTFLTREDGEPAEAGDEWLDWLVPLRNRLLELLGRRSLSLNRRLREFLRIAYRAQCLLDEENMDGLTAFCAAPCTGDEEGEAESAADWEAAAGQCLLGLDILEPDWRALLERWGAEPPDAGFRPAEPELSERIAVYFAFRYLLKAVNDGDLLGRAMFCVLGVLVTERLSRFCGLGEALRLFSREIEHDEDNLNALLDAFQEEPGLSLPALLAALGE